MDSVGAGNRRILIDKEAESVCIGASCAPTQYTTTQFITVHDHSLLGFRRNDQYILLDTGSTQTWKYNDEICILGNNDIHRLDVDYDTQLFSYDINEDNIDVACARTASAGNWNA